MDPVPETRARYRHFQTMTTRWKDNDIYGHVNNVEYYSLFDTVANEYLIRAGGLDIHTGPVIGFIVESFCQFKRSLVFPDMVEGALRVGKLGNSSVRYELALFKQGEEEPAATGYFVHVFVDRATQRPASIPDAIRAALRKIVVE